MRRTATAAVIGGALALGLPMPPASACPPSYAKPLRLSDERVAPGQSLRVAGEEGITHHCPTFGPPGSPTATGAPTGSAAPTGTVAPSASTAPPAAVTPLAPAAPVRPLPRPAPAPAPAPAPPAAPGAAAARPAGPAGPAEHPSRDHVLVELEGPLTGEGFAVDRVLARVRPRGPLGKQTFETTVTLPGDVPPGRYQLRAYQRDAAGFGSAQVTVGALPDTGAPVRDLVRLGGLALLTGCAAVAAGQRARRAR